MITGTALHWHDNIARFSTPVQFKKHHEAAASLSARLFTPPNETFPPPSDFKKQLYLAQ
jgi:hypothetical protein